MDENRGRGGDEDGDHRAISKEMGERVNMSFYPFSLESYTTSVWVLYF